MTSSYPLILLKDLNPTNSVNYCQSLQLSLQKGQPIMRYDPKSHLTNIYSSTINLEQMNYKPTKQLCKC